MTQDQRRRNCNERGMVLVTVVLLMAVLMALGTTAILQTSTDIKISGNYSTSRLAFFSAEAGIRSVIAYYLNNPTAYANQTAAGAMGFATAKPAAANLGTGQGFWISSLTYGSGTPPAWVQVECSGTVPGTNAVSTVTARYSPTYGSRFNFGAFGDEWVEFKGQGAIDSYDSDVGSYDPANHNQNGDVGTNATGMGSVNVSGGNSSIEGDAVCGPGGNADVAITEKFEGQITGEKIVAASPQDMTPHADPGGGTPASLNPGNNSVTTFTDGTYRLSELSMKSKQKVLIRGDVVLCIDGDFSTGAQNEFTVTEGSTLVMYVSGDIDMSGQGVVNVTNKPASCLIYGTATCTSVKLSGQADLYAAVYAPKATVDFQGQADFFGSMTGKTIQTGGQGGIHYDEALSRMTAGGPLTGFNLNSWRDGSV